MCGTVACKAWYIHDKTECADGHFFPVNVHAEYATKLNTIVPWKYRVSKLTSLRDLTMLWLERRGYSITGCKCMVNDNVAFLLNWKCIIDYTSEIMTTIQSIKLNQYDVYIKLIVYELSLHSNGLYRIFLSVIRVWLLTACPFWYVWWAVRQPITVYPLLRNQRTVLLGVICAVSTHWLFAERSYI